MFMYPPPLLGIGTVDLMYKIPVGTLTQMRTFLPRYTTPATAVFQALTGWLEKAGASALSASEICEAFGVAKDAKDLAKFLHTYRQCGECFAFSIPESNE